MTASRVTVLVIEDDPPIRRFLRAALEGEEMTVQEADTGRRGLTSAAARRPDLIILDLGLPDMDGLDVIRELRAWTHIPIVILSAHSQETQKVAALDAGADDYLTKPFGVPELLARLRAHLRRVNVVGDGSGSSRFRFGDVTVDLVERQVARAGEALRLTPIEYRLLAALIRDRGKVLTHRQLLRDVWGPGHAEDSHYLRVYMAQLRRKLESDSAKPKHLLTETGVGYRLAGCEERPQEAPRNTET
jgi:two-component system KDP operon response regulator KdpE